MEWIRRAVEDLGGLMVNAFDIAVFWLLGLPGVWVAVTVSAGVTRRLLRRRGRTPGKRAFLVIFCGFYLLAYSGCAAVIISNLPSRLRLPTGGLPPVLRPPLGIIGIAVLSGFLVVAVAAMLPPRRRTGPNRRLNDIVFYAIRCLGILIQVSAVPAAAAVAVLAFLAPHPGPLVLLEHVVMGALAAVLTLLLLLAIGGLVVDTADRLLRLRYTSGVGAPVLFLRPFDDEFLTFRAGKDVTKFHTFEEFLGETTADLLGPLKALGNPTDRIVPAGADRSYYSDAEWRRQVEHLADESSCILAVPSSSPAVTWELTYVRNRGYHQKLFVLTPPAAPALNTYWSQELSYKWASAAVARASQLTVSLYQGRYRDLFRVARGRQRATWAVGRYSWTDWAATLAAAGYQAGVDPGHGAVVTFSVEGQAIVLEQGAVDPVDFISPIMRRLDDIGTT